MQPVIHRSFTIERAYSASAARVFAAHADPKKKRRWFAEGAGFVVDRYELDFTIGGRESCGFHQDGGPPVTFDGVYFDIIENERIVFAYGMTVAGNPLSTSLSTVELIVQGPKSTLLRFTEHSAFLDGNDSSEGRREGSLELLERLAKELETADLGN
jgi:uncharacterized protein YndB with AHSA1/START domain